MLTPAKVERNDDGEWTHPAVIEKFSDREYVPGDEWKEWCAEHGIETCVTSMEYDLDEDHPAWIRHFEEGNPGCVGWEPEKPSEAHRVLSIHDTEDGPVVVWYRDIGTETQEVSHA